MTNLAPSGHYNAGVMLLLPDGTVLCKTYAGGTSGGVGTIWDKLTPNASGSYANGTWTSISSMIDDRLYFSSQVMKDGRVYVCGGEYSWSGGTTGTSTTPTKKGEVYDMLTDTWTATPTPSLTISDANSAMLPSGKILQAAVASDLRHTYIYDPATNTYATGPSSSGIHNESSWVTLPDQSILFVDRLATTSERYIPSTNTWIADASLPVGLYDPYGDETGAAFLLPNGKVFFIGSKGGITAIYTPSGTTSPGSWAAGALIPNIPGGTGAQGAPDAAAAMMVNGKILMAVSPEPRTDNHFPDSVSFYEYDYSSDSYSLVNGPYGGSIDAGSGCYITNMLALPNGQILFAYQGDRRYFVYTPGTSALTASRPVITSIKRNNCDTFMAIGTLFNGISEGAAYGDDWQMSTNYPLVRLTSGSNVYYTRTYDWNRTGAVSTGALVDTVQFVLPSGFTDGSYTLEVVANGNPSTGYAINTNLTISPSSANICSGTNTTLTPSWTGGTWTSSNTGIATVGSSSGVVSGVSAGVATITYSLSAGCYTTATVTVTATPSAIAGIFTLCAGNTTTLTSTPSGGTWTSGSTGIATVGSGTGTVSGVAAGSANITYAIGSCRAVQAVTVNTGAGAITGTATLCAGTTTTLNATPSGGTWTSGSTGVATVSSSTGVVTGVSSGTATITYTMSGGCFSTLDVTINTTGSPITGTASVCVGSTTTLSSTPSGGTWTSGSTGIATVGSGTGAVLGISVGTADITYSIGSCSASKTVTVNTAPGAITGTAVICSGTTTTLNSTPAGGTWTSGNTGIATVGSGTGVVSGASGGVATITYATSSTCYVTEDVTVNTTPSAITGIATVCTGSTTTLSSTPSGGLWASGSTGVATVGSLTGSVTGVSAGTADITYSLGSCIAVKVVTVNTSPSPITGTTTICAGATTTLSSAPAGGTWTSGSTAVATVGSGSGIVSGISSGTSIITYASSSTCYVTQNVTVNTTPTTITGTASVCLGSVTTLSSTPAGGTWSSSSTGVATIGSTSGTVTGVSAGTADITYTLGSCTTVKTVTVNSTPTSITGTAAVCEGSTTTLTSTPTGGTWTSGNTATATVGAGSGIVSGVAAGTTDITYALGTCTTIRTVTVVTTPGSITGAATVCTGSTTTLSSAPGSGTWTSGSSGIATIGSGTGIVTGISAGTAAITYTLGSCSATTMVTVNTTPSAITGAFSVCVGATTTLNTIPAGGTWNSGNTGIATVGSASGVVSGVSVGFVDITYTRNGCTETQNITVNTMPTAITGTASVCTGDVTTLSSTPTGGTWSSSNTSVATVGSTGIVSGVSGGVTTISYTLPGGCFVTRDVTVNTTPSAITGIATVCAGAVTTLSSSPSGGTWASGSTGIATADPVTGDITGIAMGTADITYTGAGGCFATQTVTVDVLPDPVSGPAAVCAGAIITLSCSPSGGTWTSDNPSIATVGSSTGDVTGITGGLANISYTLTNSCGTNSATMPVTVNTPASTGTIIGLSTICAGTYTILIDTVAGGVWSIINGNATISGTGLLTAITPGTDTVLYTITNSCGSYSAIHGITIGAYLSAGTISGATSVCQGSAITLSDPVPGGTWSSSAPGIASIGTSGVVTGISGGTAVISYSVGSSCGTVVATHSVSVIPTPDAGTISGPAAVCAGMSVTFTDGATGGIWGVTNPAATITSGGIVTGVTTGIDTITYVVTNACGTASASTVVTIGAAITAGSISGPGIVCEGAMITLIDATPGGIWSASNSNATVSGGLVTGVSAGIDDISYTVTSGCGSVSAVWTITINPLPNAGTISGPTAVCVGGSITLTDAVPGGTWSATNPNATVTGGVVTGVATGTDLISYSVTNSCGTMAATSLVTISDVPTAGTITGPGNVCVGAAITLSDAIPGGTWSASNANATVSVGTVTGVTAGPVIISYTVTNMCGTAFTSTPISVDPLPVAGIISGATDVCVGATITLSDAAPGGTWSAANANATVSGGMVTGVSAGTDDISYTVTNTCGSAFAVETVAINPLPDAGAIAGSPIVCVGAVSVYTDVASGGIWSTTNGNATVSSGVVSGITAGMDTLLYTVTNVCGTAIASLPILINVPPTVAPISGPASVCKGASITLTDASPGGTWSASNTKATVVFGVVTGVTAGTDTILYNITGACGTAVASKVISILQAPSPGTISGPGSVCEDLTITLTDAAPSGTWSSSNTTVASVSATGIVSGILAGAANISYTVSNSCGSRSAVKPITVINHATCNSSVSSTATKTEELKVYPNPNHGIFNMEMVAENNEKVKVTVTNIIGKVVKEFTTTTNKTTEVELNTTPGFYILSATTAGGRHIIKVTIE